MNSDFSFIVFPATREFLFNTSLDQNISPQFPDVAKESFDLLNRNCRHPTLMGSRWHLPENFEIVPNKKMGFDLLWHGDEQDLTLQINNFYTAIEHFFEEKKDDQDVYTIDCSVAQYLVMLRYVGKKRETSDNPSYRVIDGVLMVKCSENSRVNLSDIFPFILIGGQSQNVNLRHITSRGYCGYFSNLNSYYLMSAGALPSQLARMAHGLSVVSVGMNENNEMTYTGFSPLFADGPKTYKSIRDYLLHHLCEDEISDPDTIRFLKKRVLQDTIIDCLKNDPNYLYQEFDKEQDTGTHGANVCYLFQ